MTTIVGPVKNVAGELADGTLKVQSSRWRESSGSDATITPEPKTFAIVDGALNATGIDPGRASLLLQIGSSTTKPLTVDVPDVASISLHELISSVSTVDPPVATKVHLDRVTVEGLVATAEGLSTAQDEAIAALAADTGSETRAALNATYAPAFPDTAITYDGSGNVSTVTDNGITTTYTYNADGTVHTDSRVVGGVTTTRTYTYDGSGNLTGIEAA